MPFPTQHGLQSRASNSKAISGTHSTEVSSAGIVQCPPPQWWAQGRPQIPHSWYRQTACDDKGSLETQDESLSRYGIQQSLAASSDLQNGLKRHFTPHLGMENRPGKNLRKGMFRRGSTASRGSAAPVQHLSLAEAAVHMLRSALRYPMQHTPPRPHADTEIQEKSRATASQCPRFKQTGLPAPPALPQLRLWLWLAAAQPEGCGGAGGRTAPGSRWGRCCGRQCN